MEANQTNTSSNVSGIPQGIPTWVFVPNNQTSVPQASVAQTVPVESTPAAPELPLDKFFKWFVRFLAKIMGQPDPITGAPNVASQAIQKWENIVGKVRDAANQVVSKAGDVATQGVNIATNVATQAAQQVQQIIPPPTTSQTPTQETPVQQKPVTPPTV